MRKGNLGAGMGRNSSKLWGGGPWFLCEKSTEKLSQDHGCEVVEKSSFGPATGAVSIGFPHTCVADPSRGLNW